MKAYDKAVELLGESFFKDGLTYDKDEMQKKSIRNCHVKGLHSIYIRQNEHDGIVRMFHTDKNHELHTMDSIGIHPHHCSLKIVMIKGTLVNITWGVNTGYGKYRKLLKTYEYTSQINEGNGGFQQIGFDHLSIDDVEVLNEGDSIEIHYSDMHNVVVPQGMEAAWLITETEEAPEKDPRCYSINTDLSKWKPEGLYLPY